MEQDYMVVEQAAAAPLRTMPLIRKARRPRRPVFRASTGYSTQAATDERNGMDSYMSRKDDITNKYGEYDDYGDFGEYVSGMTVDDILAEFHSGTLFSDFDYSDSSSGGTGD